MPKQSRGFWVCTYCEQAFEEYQEAEQHENSNSCPMMVAAVAEPLPPWQQQQSQSQQQSQQQQQQNVYEQQQQPKQPQQRYLPLMGSQEPSRLSASDTLACRSTELFEVTPGSMYGEEQPEIGQVGLRCAFCAETSSTEESYIFPSNIRSVGDSLRNAGFEHLARCQSFPDDYRQQIQNALKRRKDIKEGPIAQEEERNRRSLIDFCAMRCQQAGIIDRHPTGMTFADSGAHLVPIPYAARRTSYPERPYQLPPPPPHPPHPYHHSPYGYAMPYGSGMEPHHGASPPPPSAVKPPPPTKQEEAPIEPTPLAAAGPPREHVPYSPIPHDFPFYFEQNRWLCKYCAHIPPPYRDPQYFWGNPNPPPPNYVDYHLSICREYQKGLMYEQPPYRQMGASPLPPNMRPPWEQSHRSATPGWEQQHAQQYRAPSTPGRYQTTPDVMSSPYNTPGGGYASATRTGIVPTPLMKQDQHMHHRTPAQSTDKEAAQAIEYLETNDLSKFDNDGNPLPEHDILVLDEDRLLLTEYFFYLMKQLRLVRFSEADRRTRGGKREKIQIGYGGLQCVHCVDIPNTRKFFWSNVDRLANSFAEIPGHVLKCRRCPQPAKDALIVLKKRHAEQMSRLPRGSQKVFFRRMWRRLHEQDPAEPVEPIPPSPYALPEVSAPPRPPPVDTKPPAVMPTQQQQSSSDVSPDATSGSEESVYFLQRPAKEAAKALMDASMQSGPPTPTSRVLLAIPEDKEWLSDTDCFIRRQLEVFCATAEDLESAIADRKYPVKEGQVGIRCIHCALTKQGAKGQAVSYPFSISGIYEAAREFQRLHLEQCENLPLSAKTKLVSLKGSSSLSSVLRKYYVLSAKALGLSDTVDGIRAGAESVPLGSQAAFAFAESPVVTMEEGRETLPPPSSQKKRKAESSSIHQRQSKKPALSSVDRMSMLAAATQSPSPKRPPPTSPKKPPPATDQPKK